ncbi:MAG: diguanylate cyclase with sensor, partial [Burkholderiales bacterium]|nr:diguanylate cyclase with sensor [Burkholderiales bacterium]
MVPAFVVAGALILLIVAGVEIFTGTRDWLSGASPWPSEIVLHMLVAGAALLLAASVLSTRRSARRTEQAEAARRDSEERLRTVADNVPALISYVDREQRYVFGNRTYGDWFGLEHEKMRGRTVAEVFGAEVYARIRPHIEGVLAGSPVEFEFATGEGERRRTLQVSCVPHL